MRSKCKNVPTAGTRASLNWVPGGKVRNGSRRQPSILQASALDNPVIKAGPFYWLKGKKKKSKKPSTFSTLRSSLLHL